MPVITTTDATNAKTDVDDLAELVNGFVSVETRTGGTKQSYSQYMSNITHGTITAYDPTATYTGIEEWASYVDTSASPNTTTVYRPIPDQLPIAPTSPLTTAPDPTKWVVAKGWGPGDGIHPPVETYSELDNLQLGGYPDGTAITLTGEGIAGTWVVGTDNASPQAKPGNVGVVRRNLNDGNRYVERVDSGGLSIEWFAAVENTDSSTAMQNTINAASAIGVAASSVMDVIVPSGKVFIMDASLGSATEAALKLKNYTRLTGGGTIKAEDSSYTTGNPPIIGNDQTVNGNTEIYVDDLTVDANATNNVSSVGGAISILFGRPIGPNGGPGQVSVNKGGITNIKCIDTSFIGVQVKDGASQVTISNIENNGGYYAVQSSNSTQIDISTIKSKNTLNNAIDVYGNLGEQQNISGKTGTFVRGEDVDGATSGAQCRLLEDNGASINCDDFSNTLVLSGKSGTFTVGETITGGTSTATGRVVSDGGATIVIRILSGALVDAETITGGTSGATATMDSRTLDSFTAAETISSASANATFDSMQAIKGNFSGSIRGVHADGCLTGVFLETVCDVPVSDVHIKNASGNGCIINRINSITSGNRVTNFTVESATSAGLLFNGEVTDNHCEISVDGATDGVRFNGSSYNSASDCKIKNVTNGYILTGTGNENTIKGGNVNTATTGVSVAAGQTETVIEKPGFAGVTARLSDSGVDTIYTPREEGKVVTVSGASNITPNIDSGSTFYTDSGNEISTALTVNAPIGAKTKGHTITLILKQDGTGGYAVTFNATFKIKTAASTTANRRSHYKFVWTGDFWESFSEVIDF